MFGSGMSLDPILDVSLVTILAVVKYSVLDLPASAYTDSTSIINKLLCFFSSN